jgi:biotin carboxyl carrier protein
MVKFRFSIGGKTYNVEITGSEKNKFDVKVRNRLLQVKVTEDVSQRVSEPKDLKASASQTMDRIKGAIKHTTNVVDSRIQTFKETDVIKTPLPGNLLEIKVSVGERIQKGDVVAIVVSMKMQNKVLSPRNGVVKEIKVSPVSLVNKGEILVVLE